MSEFERFVSIEYTRNGDGWHLVKTVVQPPEFATMIGEEALREPSVGKSEFPPQYTHIRELVLALTKHKLDGGFIHEDPGENHYCATIELKKQQEKPGHKRETPGEDLAP